MVATPDDRDPRSFKMRTRRVCLSCAETFVGKTRQTKNSKLSFTEVRLLCVAWRQRAGLRVAVSRQLIDAAAGGRGARIVPVHVCNASLMYHISPSTKKFIIDLPLNVTAAPRIRQLHPLSCFR